MQTALLGPGKGQSASRLPGGPKGWPGRWRGWCGATRWTSGFSRPRSCCWPPHRWCRARVHHQKSYGIVTLTVPYPTQLRRKG